jgi:hypothetical protein
MDEKIGLKKARICPWQNANRIHIQVSWYLPYVTFTSEWYVRRVVLSPGMSIDLGLGMQLNGGVFA